MPQYDVRFSGQLDQRRRHEDWCKSPHPYAVVECTCPVSAGLSYSTPIELLSTEQFDVLYHPASLGTHKQEFIRQKLHSMYPKEPRYWPKDQYGKPYDPENPPAHVQEAPKAVLPKQAAGPEDESDEVFEDEMEEDTPGTTAYLLKNAPNFWDTFAEPEETTPVTPKTTPNQPLPAPSPTNPAVVPAPTVPHTRRKCAAPLVYTPDPANPSLVAHAECEMEEEHPTNAPHMTRLAPRRVGQDVFIGWYES